MAEFPALPLWTDAFLSDTTHLGAAETGAYLLLLMTAWRRPNNDLPNDDKQLRRFARCSAKEWRAIKPAVMNFWTLTEQGTFRQKRLDGVREETKRRVKKTRDAARKRWDNPLKDKDAGHADASPKHGPRTSNQNHNQNHNQEELNLTAGAVDDGWPSDFREQFWTLYPHKVGKPKALVKLQRCRQRGTSWSDIMDGLKRYIATKPIDRPWLNPETFINQERWTDQPAKDDGKKDGSLLGAIDRALEKTRADLAADEDSVQRLPPGSVRR